MPSSECFRRIDKLLEICPFCLHIEFCSIRQEREKSSAWHFPTQKTKEGLKSKGISKAVDIQFDSEVYLYFTFNIKMPFCYQCLTKTAVLALISLIFDVFFYQTFCAMISRTTCCVGNHGTLCFLPPHFVLAKTACFAHFFGTPLNDIMKVKQEKRRRFDFLRQVGWGVDYLPISAKIGATCSGLAPREMAVRQSCRASRFFFMVR